MSLIHPTRSFRIFLIVCMLYLANSIALGQDSLRTHFTWFHVGLGAGFLQQKRPPHYEDRQAISFGLILAHQRDTHVFSLRFVHNEIPWFIGSATTVSDIGFLYGRGTKPSTWSASAGGGLALVAEKTNTLGVPLNAQIVWAPGSRFGLGLYAFANLNRLRSFGGFLLCVRF